MSAVSRWDRAVDLIREAERVDARMRLLPRQSPAQVRGARSESLRLLHSAIEVIRAQILEEIDDPERD